MAETRELGQVSRKVVSVLVRAGVPGTYITHEEPGGGLATTYKSRDGVIGTVRREYVNGEGWKFVDPERTSAERFETEEALLDSLNLGLRTKGEPKELADGRMFELPSSLAFHKTETEIGVTVPV